MKKQNSYKIRNNRVVFAIVFIIFLIYAIGLMTPFVYGFTIALKKDGRAFMRDPASITFPLHFENFIKAFEVLEIADNNFFQMLINSLWFSVGNTFMSIAAATCVAYVCSKYRFRGRNFIYNTIIVVMMIPIYGALPAQYRQRAALGMIDSPLLLIGSFSCISSYFIYIHAFFKTLSWTYAEAAFIDGASDWKVFIRIMVPLLLPSLTALSVMAFIGYWNDYAGTLLWLPNMPTLAAGLYTYDYNMQYEANQPLFFAGVFVSLIPVLTLFILFQNTLMTKVYAGGLKG